MNLPRIQVNWNKVLNHRRTLFITCGRFPRKTSQSLSGIVGLSQLESAQGGYRQLPRYTVCTTHSTPRPPVRSGTCEYHRIPTKQRIFSPHQQVATVYKTGMEAMCPIHACLSNLLLSAPCQDYNVHPPLHRLWNSDSRAWSPAEGQNSGPTQRPTLVPQSVSCQAIVKAKELTILLKHFFSSS